MPRFNNENNDEPSFKPAMDEIPAATKDHTMSRSPFMRNSETVQLSEAAQLASIQFEKEKWQAQQNKQTEDWMIKKWRPSMGWTYMVICILDMAVFPVLWSVVQVMTGAPLEQWNPLTLQGAGLFHLAMGAVLGVAAWSRGREKIEGVAR